MPIFPGAWSPNARERLGIDTDGPVTLGRALAVGFRDHCPAARRRVLWWNGYLLANARRRLHADGPEF